MNKPIVGILIIIVLALAAFSIFEINSLQTQLNSLQEQNSLLQTQNGNLTEQLTQIQQQNKNLTDTISQMQTRLNYSSKVEIISVQYDSGFYPAGGLDLLHPVKVTVRNNAPFTISDLSFYVKLVNASTGVEIGGHSSLTIDSLGPGEARNIGNAATAFLGADLDNASIVVVLTAGNFILDEYTQKLL
jgi:hypothetical protein